MPLAFEVRDQAGDIQKGWYWPLENAKANLCVITGMDEYAMRYAPFAERMNAEGFNVWVLDAIGQGENAESAEKQEIWPDNAFEKNLEAIHAMHVLARENGLPTYQMGHSMGSFFTQAVIQRWPHFTDGTILMGSNGGQGGLMKIAKLMAGILVNKKNRDLPNPTITALSFGPYVKSVPDAKTPVDWLSYNEENVRKYIADPFCGAPNTGGFWKEFLKGMAILWDKQEMAKVSPEERILLVAGVDDPVGQMGKGVRWLYETYRNLGVKDVTMHIYPKMRHEILNEDGKERVYTDILTFLGH